MKVRDCLGGARALTASAVTTYLYTPFLDVPYSPPLTFMNPFLWANNPHFLPLLHQYLVWLRSIRIRDGRPAPRGTLRAGRGGSLPAPPRPALHCLAGGVPRPDPPRKNDQNRGEVAGQNKGPYLNFLQKRKLMMEQYHNTEHE